MSSEVSTRRLFAALMLLALGFTSLTQTGCTSPARRLGIVDELAIAYRDRVWAQRAYNLRFANCNRQYEDHFKNGFCAGYSDVCNGGDGYLPALPPEEYRGFEYQCAEGSNCVDTWFDGYPAGVAAAREEDAGSYHSMHVSRMIDDAITQNNASNVLPSDVPVTKPSASLIPPTPPTARTSQAVTSRKFGQRPAMPTFSKPPRPATTNKPKSASVKSASVKSAPVVPARVASKPSTPQPVLSKPPIIKGKSSTIAPPQQLPPRASSPAGSGANKALPPIVTGSGVASSTPAPRPPVVRGRKIDPSATVSASEIPLPFAVRSTFDSRTAAWPTTNRK